MPLIKPKVNPQFSDLIVDKPSKIKLSKHDSDYKPKEVASSGKKKAHNIAAQVLALSRNDLINAQEKLWACKKYGILIVLQGMDTAGKDGTIRHIMSGINPQGCRVECFKTPTNDEHAHDFLWRYSRVLPKRGEIVIFNRSYYEDVLAVKVHPEYMEELSEELSPKNNKKFWQDRFEDINAFEKHLARNGILVLKFFLHISKDEQKKRLLERLSDEEKYWKVSPSDLKERKFWDSYVLAYEDALSHTGQSYAPWVIVPANDKKIARAIVADIIADAINNLKIDYPKLSKTEIQALTKAKLEL